MIKTKVQNKSKELKEKPLVSVVIPVFNGSSYLEETVKSVQKSQYQKFEILLIDDGSTDKSKHICHSLEKKYKNVRFFSFPKNRGLGNVLNFALKKAHGEFICRINQDDRMLPFRIQTQVNFLTKNTQVVAVGSCIKLFRNEKNKYEIVKFLETDEEIKRVWLLVSPFADPSVMYRKTIAIKAGGYDQRFWPGDDTHLWMKMGIIGKLANIQEPLVEVRFHNNAASVKHFRELTLVTYKLHRWAHNTIQNAPLLIQGFWVIQLGCGLMFSPQFNWNVYRILKRIINPLQAFLGRLMNQTAKNKTLIKVRIQPKKLRLSGT
ncbi:MAG TPA: glycosyltransferase [Candidatus Nitrosocosmicus sp.]|nr:glycosyltransferase [Candidatus Nitrosocosmicus sp.]